jgi:CheY-like chemotaxis protein
MPKILIVEDDQVSQKLLKIRLEQSGYETAFASDAYTAITMAKEERPDLILLDFGLPGGDGAVVMERLQMFPALTHIPVIVVSAREPAATEERSLVAGAVAFVQKPIDAEELLGAVRSALHEEDPPPATAS